MINVTVDGQAYTVEIENVFGMTVYTVEGNDVNGVVTADHNVEQVFVDIDGEFAGTGTQAYADLVDWAESSEYGVCVFVVNMVLIVS